MSARSYAICPVSDKKINESVARINGGFTILLLLISVWSHSVIPVVFLAVDFFLRSSQFSNLSPVSLTSRSIVRNFGLPVNIINAGPKIFAARIGFVFSVLIIISYILNISLAVAALSSILILFSGLESILGYCVACEIYPFVYRWIYKERFI
jgi:hypothetical protein